MGEELGKLPGVLDMWEDVPVSMYQSLALGGGCVLMPAEDRAERRAVWSQIEDEDDPTRQDGPMLSWAIMACYS